MTLFFGSESNPAQRRPFGRRRPDRRTPYPRRAGCGTSRCSGRSAAACCRRGRPAPWTRSNGCASRSAHADSGDGSPRAAPHAVGSGASGRSSVAGSSASRSSRSEARMREKCIWLGLIRNSVPASRHREAEMVGDRLVQPQPRGPAKGGGEVGSLLRKARVGSGRWGKVFHRFTPRQGAWHARWETPRSRAPRARHRPVRPESPARMLRPVASSSLRMMLGDSSRSP